MNLSVTNLGLDIAGKTVLDDITLDVHAGEFLSLLGESGAGKSTLLKIIAGITIQSRGTVAFDGACVDETACHRRRCAMVFQDIRLFPNMNARDNVAFPARMAHTGRRERREHADALLAEVGLTGLGDRTPSQLSGGQQQRVALARALASNPAALLLDEPFAGLDEQLRDDMRSLVLKLHRASGITCIMVTHDAGEALRMSDRIAYLSLGRLIQVGTPQQLYKTPASAEIAQCTGACSQIEGTVENGVFIANGLRIPAANTADGSAIAIVRNAGVTLEEKEDGPLVVRCGVYAGEAYLARIDIDDQTLTAPVANLPKPETRVTAHVNPQHCFVFPRV